MTPPADMTQPQEESWDESAPSTAEEAAWGRLICLAPVPGIHELRQRQVVMGRTTNNGAHVQIDDGRVSSSHCKIFRTPEGTVQLLDLSSNGTYVNAKIVGKSKLHTLVSGDEISLLNPNPSSHPAGGCVKPTHYHYLYQDLRPPQQPTPPKRQPRLLQNTSFYQCDKRASKEDYETVERLGSGSFATVDKVRHVVTGNFYAMKVMQKKKLLGARTRGMPADELTRRTLSEARILKSLEHPNIIKYYDVLETETELCLLVELVEGGELFEHLIEHGAFCETGARAIMKQLLEAVGYLHSRNIIHRDLKPENILLKQPAKGDTVPTCKIADFGLAKLIGNEKVTSTFCGTPQYFAPEVLGCRESKRGYDSACDLWSLGVILYILLSGTPPFDERREYMEADATAPQTPAPSIFDQIRVGIRSSIHFASAPWPSISASAKHLVKQLLDVDPQRRLGVAGALKHPWMRGLSEVEDESSAPMHRPSTPLEDISEYSDDEDAGVRPPQRRSDQTKRQRVAPIASALMPLQPYVLSNRPTAPPPVSQPHFKHPHLPKRANGVLLGNGKSGRGHHSSGSRFGALNIKMS